MSRCISPLPATDITMKKAKCCILLFSNDLTGRATIVNKGTSNGRLFLGRKPATEFVISSGGSCCTNASIQIHQYGMINASCTFVHPNYRVVSSQASIHQYGMINASCTFVHPNYRVVYSQALVKIPSLSNLWYKPIRPIYPRIRSDNFIAWIDNSVMIHHLTFYWSNMFRPVFGYLHWSFQSRSYVIS